MQVVSRYEYCLLRVEQVQCYLRAVLAKVGITSYRECFICACIDITTQLELCLNEQTQRVTIAACRMGSQQSLSRYVASWLANCFITFIVIPKYIFKYSLFIFHCTIIPRLSALRPIKSRYGCAMTILTEVLYFSTTV